jgi:hypothetical protein
MQGNTLTEADVAAVARTLTDVFEALTLSHNDTGFARVARAAIDTVQLYSQAQPLLFSGTLGAVGGYAGAGNLPYAAVSDAFRLAGNELMRVASCQARPLQTQTQADALVFYACASMSLPIEPRFRLAHTLPAYALHVALETARREFDTPQRELAKALIANIQNGQDMKALAVTQGAVPTGRRCPLPYNGPDVFADVAAAAQRFVTHMHDVMNTPH